MTGSCAVPPSTHTDEGGFPLRHRSRWTGFQIGAGYSARGNGLGYIQTTTSLSAGINHRRTVILSSAQVKWTSEGALVDLELYSSYRGPCK